MTPEEILRVEKDIVLTLKNVYDPEIPVNIYDLGLIYEIDFDPSGEATIRMTLTAPNCPMADMLVEDVNTQVAKVNGVEKVEIDLPTGSAIITGNASFESIKAAVESVGFTVK